MSWPAGLKASIKLCAIPRSDGETNCVKCSNLYPGKDFSRESICYPVLDVDIFGAAWHPNDGLYLCESIIITTPWGVDDGDKSSSNNISTASESSASEDDDISFTADHPVKLIHTGLVWGKLCYHK